MTIAARKELPPFLRQSKNDIHAKFIDLEWQQRNRLLQGTQKPLTSSNPNEWARPAGDHINLRNRYGNVVPFERNRIKLPATAGDNDYINASPISLGDRRYIATQGPLEVGVNHFYRMLDAETKGEAIVIMLTQTHESGKEKCFRYYPMSTQEPVLKVPKAPDALDGYHGSVKLVSCEDDVDTRSQIRRMTLHAETDGQPARDKQIIHFLFSGWPDFLVPEGDDKAALVRLLDLSARLNNTPIFNEPSPSAQEPPSTATEPHINPRIIHCSAGVGRSGTFIALDYLLGLLYAGKFDNLTTDWDPVADTVEELRKQRMMMVQGEGQFFFVYDVLREKLTERFQGFEATS